MNRRVEFSQKRIGIASNVEKTVSLHRAAAAAAAA
jgi:hypothetical protein